MHRTKVLVTGANGFIGRALCERLMADGRLVIGAVRSDLAAHRLPEGVESFTIGDIGPDTQWGAALSRVDTLVHLAARVHLLDDKGPEKFTAYRLVNVDGTRKLAQTAAAMDVGRFVFLSSVKVNGEGRISAYTESDECDPSGPYAVSKCEAEQALHAIADQTGLEVVVLRPPLVYGPRVKANFLQLLKLVDRGIPLPLAGVKNQRSLIYLENLLDAIIACIRHPKAAGQTYLVSDGNDLSVPELIKKVASALGKPSRVFPFPIALLRISAKILGKTNAVNRLVDSLTVNSSKIRSDLDWTPLFTTEDGIKETAKWYLTKYSSKE